MQENADIKIVMMGVRSAADIYWVVKPNSPIKTVKDLEGKKLAITSPKSVTDSLSTMVLEKHGLFNKVERPALGTVGAGLTALDKDDLHWAFYSFREDAWDGMDYELGSRAVAWEYWQQMEANERDTTPRKSTLEFAPISRRLANDR